ncbi:MAG: CPXCG motif-containing cysteine-rich protein [Flavobacteriaceae bacterium]|nr:CPXCG motif-containing cysteine-rich protein [Flavobacteriaceae bacterium]
MGIYCWSEISMLFDSSVTYQVYVEDCEVCCNPIEVNSVFDNGELISLECKSLEQ